MTENRNLSQLTEIFYKGSELYVNIKNKDYEATSLRRVQPKNTFAVQTCFEKNIFISVGAQNKPFQEILYRLVHKIEWKKLFFNLTFNGRNYLPVTHKNYYFNDRSPCIILWHARRDGKSKIKTKLGNLLSMRPIHF